MVKEQLIELGPHYAQDFHDILECQELDDEQAQVLLEQPDSMTVLSDAVKDQDTRRQNEIMHVI